MRKFELTNEYITIFPGRKLFRIRALIDFGKVKKGETGGFVEKEENLSHKGNAWVFDNAWVSDNACVGGDAWVCGKAQVYGNAQILDNARVYDNVQVCGDARVVGSAKVSGYTYVGGDTTLRGEAEVYSNLDYACVKGFGSEQRHTTFFRTIDGDISVSCGCFMGTLQEFRNKVKETHGESKIAKEYLMIADLMEYHFKEDEQNG